MLIIEWAYSVYEFEGNEPMNANLTLWNVIHKKASKLAFCLHLIDWTFDIHLPNKHWENWPYMPFYNTIFDNSDKHLNVKNLLFDSSPKAAIFKWVSLNAESNPLYSICGMWIKNTWYVSD